ncbi:tail fiber assembly protein [Citrobacter sp. BDA59-3]|uniref:tail fiber assembly protein n=1 Tax=Citrobacter sp. BDA59-3 TaxID=2781952 RepID=UPI001881908E|nr:tail fiber assembly protein [Citrobacter sp. BDA59-3]QOV70577.1 tail fiber assembly protein [Citrobacter sp. BDA59-3]
MKYFYSISTQGFYLDNGMLDAYEAAGSLPADLQEISEADYLAFFNPPAGFAGIFDENGPRVSRLPELDPVAIAENQRRLLLSEIAPTISVWQTKILVGMKLSDSETAALHAWLSYSDALNELDITAPDIQWPEKPAPTS